MNIYQEIFFETELPKEKEEIFFLDKNGKKYTGFYTKGFVVHFEMHPVHWYKSWLKEIKSGARL